MAKNADTKERIISYEIKDITKQKVIERIIESLDAGVVPWGQNITKPAFALNYESGEEYSYGLGWFMLNCLASYESPYYLTWHQIKDFKGKVKKGSVAEYWYWYQSKFLDASGKPITKSMAERLENRGEQVKEVRHLRSEAIFNSSSIEQIEFHNAPWLLDEYTVEEECDIMMQSMLQKPELYFIDGKDGVKYLPDEDKIYVPKISHFENNEKEFYALLFPELIHWTGSERRLARKVITKRVDTKKMGYAIEHLVGEIGATYLCSYAGMNRADYVSYTEKYLSFWKTALESSPDMFFTAVRQAQEAADYILNR